MEIIVILVICGIVAAAEMLLYKKMALKHITYKVTISTAEAYEGDEIEVIEEIANCKWLPVPWLKSEISTSKWLSFAGTHAGKSSDSRFVPSVFALHPNQKCTRKWKVTCLKRGVFSLTDTSIVASDILGLVTVSVKIAVDAKLIVLPRPMEVEKGKLSADELFGKIIVKRFICPDPFEISGVREYSPRDSMSSIHWQSTAKQQRLMVYNNDYTTSNRMLILMNMQRNSGGNSGCASMTDIESFIKICAFLSEQCRKKEMRVSFAANGSNENGVFAENITHYSLLYKLAEIELRNAMRFPEMLEQINMANYTDIVILTPYICRDMIMFAEKQRNERRNVIFYCPEECDIPYQLIPFDKDYHYYQLNNETAD